MKLLAVFLFLIELTTLGCGKNDSSSGSNSTPAFTNADTLKAIEQQAIHSGVSIRHDDARWSDLYRATIHPITISSGGVGYTEDELKSAIEVLRNYHSAVTSSDTVSSEGDRKQQLETINAAMTDVQGKRNDILSKKICESK